MRLKKRSSLCVLMGLLALAISAKAAPPGSISGPVTVCAGSSGSYSVTPLPHILFLWSTSSSGVITVPGTPGPTATVLWGVTGPGTITVTEIVDSTAAVYGTLSLAVTVEPVPAPVITSNVVVGCQTLDDSVVQSSKGTGHTQHVLDDSTGCVKVCEGSVVTYTATGLAGDVFGWSIAGGTVLAQGADTCMVLWGPAGAGTVAVSDTSIYGCIGTKSICIDIISKPQAHFYAMPDSLSDTAFLCLNGTAMFVDNSTASMGSPIVSWYWDFGDGHYFTSGSSGPQPHTYTTPGTDTAKLVVRNGCGCTDTFTMIVVVSNTTGVTIACPGVVCDSATATYTLTPTPPCPTFLWTVNGGTITANNDSNITVLWNNVDTTGFGYVIFDASPCSISCPGITVIKVPVIQAIGHISGPKVDCDNSQYVYSLPQWPTTVFNWTVSGTTTATLSTNDQNNQIVLNTHGPGTVYLVCNYNNTLLGCSGVAYDTITVLPSDSLYGPQNACLNATSGIYTVGAGLNTNWTLTDPTGIVISTATTTSYTTPVLTAVGTYTITVTPGTGALYCPIAPYLVKVAPLPPAPDSILGPDTTCFGTPAIYTAYNPIPGDIFEWAAVTGSCNAADGNTSSITFTGGGASATIELWRVTSSSPHCHSDTITKTVYRPYVNINITAVKDTVCPSSVMSYNANYTQGETYTWSVYNPLWGSVAVNGKDTCSILWNNFPGDHAYLILKVRKCDSTYTDSILVVIRNIPAISISATNPVCLHAPMSVTLNPLSIVGGISWAWGDGTPDGGGNPSSHIYNSLIASSTTYTVTATVLNPYGCLDTISTSIAIAVLPAPVASISATGPLSFCPPTPIDAHFTAILEAGYEATDSLAWWGVTTGLHTTCAPPTCTGYTGTHVDGYFVIAIGANGCADTSNIIYVDTNCSHSSMPCTMNPTPWAIIDTATVNCGVVHLHGKYDVAVGLTYLGTTWGPPLAAMGITTTSTTLDCHFDVAGNYDFTYSVRFADLYGDTCSVTYDTSVLVPLIAGSLHTIACTGSTYSVTLLDHSNYYPGHQPASYSWYVSGMGFVAHTWTPSYTLTLSPGIYDLGEWVHYAPDSTNDSCWADDSLILPAVPSASFTFGPDTTCAVQAAVIFNNTSTPATGLSNLWSFGDGATNSVIDPYRVYAAPPLVYTATLTVTNQYGCTSSATHFIPLVVQDLDGSLAGGGTFCAGTPVLLSYTLGSSLKYPEHYYWMQATDSMYMSAYPVDYTYVFTSGSYWVIGTNHYGCYIPTKPQVVNVIQVPPAVITGDQDACFNVPYTLNGWAGDDPNLSYEWFKNHVPDGTGPTITDPSSAVTGVPDTFMLVVRIAAGTDTCSDTSALFLVTVHPQPAPPTITAHIVDCNSYTLQLNAIGPIYGDYNWSNGLSGQNITVTSGGPYGVWYTDTFGCTSFGSQYIDKDPRAYLWIFPTGCYEWCSNKTPVPYIVGPVIPFSYWAYQYAPVGPVIIDGYNWYVPSWYPPGSGDYNLILENHYCEDTSGVLDITIDSNCTKPEGCACLKMSLNSWTTACPPPSKPTCCQWHISLCITNSCDPIIRVNIISGMGTFTPPIFNIPTGNSCDTFTFTPTGTFAGGWVHFFLVYAQGGKQYQCPDSVYLAPCGKGGGGGGTSRQGNGIQETDGIAMLDLAPNPAQNTTRVDYGLNGTATSGSIEVYDMMGRLVSSCQVTGNEGSWQLQLDNYAAGVYVVMLRQEGVVIKQTKLSVIR